ncbi:glycosyltransferase family 4 protein [Macrococcus equipercicus]|uniref:Glycosyltransferase family 4 protein n=1 Tax=Macrococcus equipercicus TaxID=69967 RepID=A0A9Q9BLY9_9STAP|nr:glycosyltransferase family 4 protein [Macrococcus equipercicus]UTH13595.1 glycosyltransferase family 4 protein [Macrococcus equipercicus]
MKILFFTQYYEPEPFLIHDKTKELVNNGNEVTVVTGLPNYPKGEVMKDYKPGKQIIDGVNIVRLPIRPRKTGSKNLFLNYISYVIQGNKFVKSLDANFDVVYVYQLSPVFMAIPGIKYKKKFKKNLIIYCLDLWPESLVSGGIKKDRFIYNVFKIISKRIYKQADSIHISSRQFPKYFNEVLNVKKKFIYNPQYAVETSATIMEKSPYDDKKINITFTGNVGEMQSLDTVVNAMSIIESDNVQLNIVGDGSQLENLKSLVKDLDITEKVIFHGRKPVEQMDSYLHYSDALIISMKDDEAISYTMPAKLQSYLKSGKFIIGTINGEAARVIQEANVGIVSNAGNIEQLARNIELFMKKKDDFILNGKNGKKYYYEKFGKDKFIKILIEDLKRLSNS